MAGRVVVLSVQASQDQQNNSVKHPETVSLFTYVKITDKSLSFCSDTTLFRGRGEGGGGGECEPRG